MSDQDRTRPSGKMFDDISVFLGKEGGSFALSYSKKRNEWMAALEFGQEAPDSPMVGGAAYAVHEVPAVAVEMCLRKAGI